MSRRTSVRSILSLLRNLALAGLIYACVYGIIHLSSDPIARSRARKHVPSVVGGLKGQPEVDETKQGIAKVKVPGSSRIATLNPHANVFNRPFSAVKPRDGFYGPRPHVDTEADLQVLVEECRGTYDGIEKMRNVFDCLQFLANGQERYHFLPEPVDRASEQDPRQAEYLDADGAGNVKSSYVSVKSAKAPTSTNRGTCAGPIIPYHVYWTGPASWRVEVFIKAYLYTQNVACSQLWLWLDADRSPKAVHNLLNNDPLFVRFLPLVERGDIKVLEWQFPSRIPMPKGMDHTDGIGYYQDPGKPNAQGETTVADGIIEDAHGQQWLTLTPKQMTFLPQAISDAVRFVILHLHGGLYLDMDVLMLRDMRPLLLPQHHNFAERWAAHSHPGDYNTAIMSLTANSSLSSYLLRGGVRMGLNFHPRVIGRMAWKDKRDQELFMLETAAFDPIWTEFNWDREGRCTVPCLRDYGAVFKGKPNAVKDEWESYDGPQFEELDLTDAEAIGAAQGKVSRGGLIDHVKEAFHTLKINKRGERRKRGVVPHLGSQDTVDIAPMAEPLGRNTTTTEELDVLEESGLVKEYVPEEDKYPPNNRTLENFFRGAWTYHIHNQVSSQSCL